MVPLPDDRQLEVLLGGAPQGRALFFHGGSPSAVCDFPLLDRVAAAHGLRTVTCSRPGYGASTPRPDPAAARVADDVADTAAVLDHLGIEDFVTLGWSGGGPRALGCAALLPGRCRAAATGAGVAPYDAEGLDWFHAMAEDNREEYSAAAQGPEAYTAWLTENWAPVLQMEAADLVAAMGDLLTPVDRTAAAGEIGTYLAESMLAAGRQGVRGMRDDGLQILAAWGFDLGSIAVPVAVWQGREDAMVPYTHGAWLAGAVPGARAHLFEEEGHVSLVEHLDAVVGELVDLAGWA